jgi:hypothetical protein
MARAGRNAAVGRLTEAFGTKESGGGAEPHTRDDANPGPAIRVTLLCCAASRAEDRGVKAVAEDIQLGFERARQEVVFGDFEDGAGGETQLVLAGPVERF